MAFIRIDPALPIVWRSPNAIQIGASPPLVTLDPLSASEERMLAAVRAGIPAEGLAAVGGCSAAHAAQFLDRVRPALAVPSPMPARVAVRVTSGARDEIVRTARMLGLVRAAPRGRPGVGVIVADHVVPQRAYRDWLRDGIPHFAVILGARDVVVGPVVRPGSTGCLRCADLVRRSLDPAWPAVASQLAAMPAASGSDALARTEALCVAMRLAVAIDAGQSVPDGGRIDPHPDCGCSLDLSAPQRQAG